MCGYGWRGLCACGGPWEAMRTPYRLVPRPRWEEETYLEEYQKNLERALADVTERLKILKQQT